VTPEPDQVGGGGPQAAGGGHRGDPAGPCLERPLLGRQRGPVGGNRVGEHLVGAVHSAGVREQVPDGDRAVGEPDRAQVIVRRSSRPKRPSATSRSTVVAVISLVTEHAANRCSGRIDSPRSRSAQPRATTQIPSPDARATTSPTRPSSATASSAIWFTGDGAGAGLRQGAVSGWDLRTSETDVAYEPAPQHHSTVFSMIWVPERRIQPFMYPDHGKRHSGGSEIRGRGCREVTGSRVSARNRDLGWRGCSPAAGCNCAGAECGTRPPRHPPPAPLEHRRAAR
jgi:hypothetical protein